MGFVGVGQIEQHGESGRLVAGGLHAVDVDHGVEFLEIKRDGVVRGGGDDGGGEEEGGEEVHR